MRKIHFIMGLLLSALSCRAQVADVLVDFEDKAVGEVIPVFSLEGSAAARAVVAADPLNAQNKVVHVTTGADATESALNVRVVNLPTGKTLGDYEWLAFDYYRADEDLDNGDAYVSMNGKEVWRDARNICYEARGRWNRRVISLEALKGNTKTRIAPFRFGYLGGGKDYYLDNIRLVRDVDYGYDLDDPATTLRHYADALGINVGVAMGDGQGFFLSNGYAKNPDSQLTRTFTGLFNLTVCENDMKWEVTEPEQGKFNFSLADQLVEVALANGMKVRGHTLCWPNHLPGWVYGLKTREEMMAALKNHVQTVVDHYKGKVFEWDVCNEMIDAGQEDGLCRDLFYNVFGPDYLDSCFVWAHEADPDARLVMNDFLVEIDGDGKAMKLLDLAVKMKRKGIPIDGVGWQCHCYWLGCFAWQKQKMKTLINRYARYGLDVSFTEMDQGIGYNDRDKLSAWEAQAPDYRTLMELAVECPNVSSIIVWGMNDPYSWRPSYDGAQQPLILGDYLQAKPAYTQMLDVLKASVVTGIETVETTDGTRGNMNVVYNLAGQQVDASYKGIVIKNGKKILQR